MRSSAHPANFQAGLLRSPEPTNSVRRPASIDRYGARSGTVTNELPYPDPQARYSISYVPGMSEHVVNTGKTLPEAQLKVVLLSCEIERLNTMNYNLVKENEVLNARNKRSDREIDLENKLAIVLAENEKLNQIVEELHGVYARERESLNNEDYERRISELLQDLEEWKHKYNRLEGEHPGSHDFKHTIEALTNERELLREQLGRQGRDLEALRARLAALQQVGPTDSKFFQEQISNLKIENETLRSELATMKLKYGNADALQERLNQYDQKLRVLLSENEKLNNLLVEQSRDLQNSQREIAAARQELLNQSHHNEERVKRAAKPGQELAAQTNAVLEENNRLNRLLQEKLHEIEELKHRIHDLEMGSSQTASYREKLSLLTTENERLNNLVHELRAEIEHVRLQAADATKINQLTSQIHSLLEENRRLNDLVVERSSEVDKLRRRISELESGNHQLAALTNDNNRLNSIIAELRAENERLRHQAGDTTKITQLSTQIHGLLDENARLNHLVGDLKAENERLRAQAGDTTKITQLSTQIHGLLDENSRLNHLVGDLKAENERLRAQAGDNTKITQLSAQIHGLLDENKRLNDLVLERARENERLRARIVELEMGSSQTTELRGKLTLLAADNEKLNHIIADLRGEVERLHRQLSEAGSSVTRIETLNIQITQLNGQLTNLTEENRRLNAIILERTREIEQLRIQVSEGRGHAQQVASLAEENRRLASLLEEARNRYLTLEKDSHEVVHLRSRITSLTSEIERLGASLSDRNREIDEARRRHVELSGSLHQVEDLRSKLLLLTQENERLNNIIVDKLRESDSMKVRISSLESSGLQIHSLEDRIHHLTGERDRINSILSERLREIDTLRSKIVQLESSGSQVGELKSKLELLIRENTRLNDALIERAREIDVLRRKLTELEASSQNYLTIQNRYSILVNDSQAAFQERDTLKAQLALVIAERDRLNILLSEKVAECDSLRTRHSKDLEASPSRTRESITRASNVARQDQATEQLKRVYEEAIQNLESRVKLLDAEVGRLIGVLSDRDHELETWRGRSKEFTFTTQENARLNQLLTDRLREIEDLRREIPSPGLKRGESERANAEAEYKKLLEAQLSEVSARNAEERQRLLQQLQELQSRLEVVSADNQRLSVTVNQAHQENESWKHRFEQLERQRDAERHQELERRTHESPKRAHAHVEGGEEQISEKVDFLNHEIERLQEHLNNTLKELEDWRKRYSELEILRTQELDALRHQFEDSKRFTIEAREVSTKFNAERAAYEAQLGQLQQRVVDSESQLRLIASENERVLRLSNTRSTEAEESKRKYQELKSSQSIEINQLRSQVEAFKANTTDVKQLAIKYSADKAADQSQIKQLKQVNENYKTEIEKLYELIEQRKADFENLTAQNQSVLVNFERITEELRTHSTSAYSHQEKLEIALREVQDLKASRDEFKNQAERNSTELTRKNKELIDRIQEVDVLKLRYEESLANYHALNVKLFEKLSH